MVFKSKGNRIIHTTPGPAVYPGKENKMDHKYKGFEIWRTGTKDYPWNIYRMDYNKVLKKEVPTHVGFAATLKACRECIDMGLCNEEI